ncbi:hypothetical protein [Mycobacterium leprae]|uniref:hypothetical protein n=1 Tax=Mycobacterium leprae TaxID=1769 RepID=UPI000A6D2AB0
MLALGMTRLLADVWFSAAALSWVGRGYAVVSAALEIGAALLIPEQLGVAQWCLTPYWLTPGSASN